MAKRLVLFNHKGGVSKTTTLYNVGWMLAEQGHGVLLVPLHGDYDSLAGVG